MESLIQAGGLYTVALIVFHLRFRLNHWASWAFLGWFLLGTVLYAIPAANAVA